MQPGETPQPAAAPEAAAAPATTAPDGRRHLVVVTTREVDLKRDTAAPPTSRLVTRFWHPRDRCWTENYFETLEHAARLFVDESGWLLIQQQAVAGPLAWELIFEARRADFARPSTDDILRDIGISRERVDRLLEGPPGGGPR